MANNLITEQKKTIMFIYAHPDDETFGAAGTIYKHSLIEDVRIHVVSATRGEAGKMGDPPLTTRENLGQFREGEMRAAAEILNIDQISYLDFIDATLDKLSETEEEELVEKITNIIIKYKPEVLVIFPEDGISNHKDHIAMHYASIKAINRAKKDYIIPKLYYNVVPKAHYNNRNLENRGVDDNQITTTIDISPYLRQKYEAVMKHQTQVFSINKVYPGILESKDINLINSKEYFKLVEKNGQPFKQENYQETSLL